MTNRLITRSKRGGSVVRVNFKQRTKLLNVLREFKDEEVPLIVVSSPQKRDKEFRDLRRALRYFNRTSPPVVLSIKTARKDFAGKSKQILASM
jgi:hypothetical protein